MTRGQIAIITPEGNIMSCIEFNGNMYFTNGHGEEVYPKLAGVENVAQYQTLVENFNSAHFRYEEDLFYNAPANFFDMQNDYFRKWFSDYVYIKNLSPDTREFLDRNGDTIICEPGDCLVFNYGEFFARSVEDCYRKDFLSELEYIQSSFGSDLLLNYQHIEKCCREYDQNTGSNTQRHLEESDFVYGETLDMLVLSEAKDLTKLFHFMRKLEHVNDEIYILDAYGSLRNAEVSDLECLIEDIQRTVNNNGAAFNKSDTEMG